MKTAWLNIRSLATGLAAVIFALAMLAAGCVTAPTSTTISTPPGTTGATESPSVSNGEQIYLHARSASGTSITYSDGPGMMMQGPLSCAACHGADGHGGTIYVMMRSYDAPDITWPELTGPHPDHQPYTVATIEQAITQGVDPAGNPLEYPMPRWHMSQSDLADLISYMMTLR